MKKNGDRGDSGKGNTSPRVSQLKKWFFTWNNYQIDKIKEMETLFSKICIKGLFQSEVGEEGTPHLQGAIWLKKEMRWTEFNLPKEIHWEKMKSDTGSLKYCRKDGKDGFDGKFRWSLNMPKPLKCLREDQLYEWQKETEKYCLEEPDGQSVKWIYDSVGGKGKSSFCRYMAIKHNTLVIRGGKLADIMNIIFNTNMDYVNSVLIDIPRCNKNKVSYASIECILDGMITNTKFETGRKIFNPPNVVVFSNFPPEMNDETLSMRRWKIKNLNEDDNNYDSDY